MTTRPSRAPSAVRALATALDTWAGPLRHGLDHSGTLREGDLEIEVSIRVRRIVPASEVSAYKAEALARLALHPIRATVCCCSVGDPHAGKFSQRAQHDCSRPVAAVLIARALHGEGRTTLPVCKRHRETHRIPPHEVLAVVNLSAEELAPILRDAQRQIDEHRQAERARDEAEEAAQRTLRAKEQRVACPRCGAGIGASCRDERGRELFWGDRSHPERLLALCGPATERARA